MTSSLPIFVTAPVKTNMAAVPGYLHLQYSSKDIFTISLLQVVSTWTAAAVSNYTLPRVSLISHTARSLRIFCLVFSLLSFTLLRFKSKVKFTVSCFDLGFERRQTLLIYKPTKNVAKAQVDFQKIRSSDVHNLPMDIETVASDPF